MSLIESVRKLPLNEKWELFETLWDDLADDPEQMEIPDWHMEILEERAALLREGKAVILDWEEVKKRLKKAE